MASSVWMRQTRRCSLTGMRAWRLASEGIGGYPLNEQLRGYCELRIANCELQNERQNGSKFSSFCNSQFAIRNSQFLLPHHRLVRDPVTVPLLGQKQLPMMGEILFSGIARHQRVEMGHLPVGLGAQNTAQALGFFLA